MKSFACGDVVPGCAATFTAETVDAMLQQVVAHAAADHDMPVVPDEVAQQVVANIR